MSKSVLVLEKSSHGYYLCSGKFYGSLCPDDEALLTSIGFEPIDSDKLRWRLGPFKTCEDAIAAAHVLGAVPLSLVQLLCCDKFVRHCLQHSDEVFEALVNLERAEGLPHEASHLPLLQRGREEG